MLTMSTVGSFSMSSSVSYTFPPNLATLASALALVREHGIGLALLKARSPSCGNLENYDGSFSGVRVAGEGVTAALLKRAGVKVFNELQLDEASAELARLERN